MEEFSLMYLMCFALQKHAAECGGGVPAGVHVQLSSPTCICQQDSSAVNAR